MLRSLASIALVSIACGPDVTGQGQIPTRGDPAPEPEVTYHRDVRPLLERHCLSCHVEDGIGPFVLTSYPALVHHAPLVARAVEEGRMPPWLPDPTCRRYRSERLLTEEEKTLFRRWIDEGMIEGDPRDHRSGGGGPGTLGPPTLTLEMPEYRPPPERGDDYRCFLLAHDFTRDTYVRTSNIIPLRRDVVHHALLYLIPPESTLTVAELDASEQGPGYRCFGGIGVSRPTPIAAWVPGMPIEDGSEDAAIRIPAGAKVVLQMHYHVPGVDVGPDRTSIDLWLLPERPPFLLEPRFFPHFEIDIRAGDPSSHQAITFINDEPVPWTIVSTTPHMHLLGTRIRTTKISSNGSEECLVDIPKWDFHWQQTYGFRAGEEVEVQPGEELRLECWFDNSRGTENVGWGERTVDEMCLNTLVLLIE